jgi:hypothetical protein
MLSAAYLIACAAIAYFGSKRATTPHARAVLWLGLLTLGALSSPGAWSDYVLISAVWMLAFVSAPLPAERGMRAALAACWLLTIMQPGVLPLIPVDGESTRLILAAIGHSSVLILCAASLIGRRSYAEALAERSAVIPAGG